MRRTYTVVALSVISCIIIFSCYVEGFFTGSSGRTDFAGSSLGGSVGGTFRVALIDALFNSSENDQFGDAVNKTLHEAGFTLDVYQGKEVTVASLERFAGGYELVVLRMHSALSANNELYLFTAEPYSSEKYSQEQYFGLVREAYATESSQPVFAVNWGFVKRVMTGRFNGTTVIAMGCAGACDPSIAQEFINQGAVGYVGWNGPVLLSHSDSAVLRLIGGLCLKGQPLKEAVGDANSQIGPDPASGSVLKCYTV